MFITTSIILGLTLLGNYVLLMLLTKDIRSLLQYILLIYVASITGWTAAIFCNLWLENIFIEHLVFFFAAVFLTAQFWFAKLFPESTMPQSLWEYWGLTIGVAFAFVSLYPGAVFSSFSVEPGGYTIIQNGYLSTQYSIFALVYVCAPIFMLTRKYYRESNQLVKKQLMMLISGFSVFAVVNVVTNSILPVFYGIYFFNAIGPVFSVLLAAFILYSIRQLRLFDIRSAVQRSVFYSFVFALTLLTYTGILGLIHYVFMIQTKIAAPFTAGFILLVGVFTLPYFERQFRHYTDRLFFKGQYDYSKALETISSIVHETIDSDELTTRAADHLAGILRAEKVVISASKALHETIMHDYGDESIDERRHIFVPIKHDGVDIGYIHVYEKRSGDAYSDQDVQLLKTLAHHAGTALERAMLFQSVREYSRELEKKVAARTAELLALQSYQRQMLDEIAHSLETPLTVIQNELTTLPSTIDAEHVNSFKRSIAALEQFTHQLLRLSQLDAPGNDITRQHFNVSELVLEVMEYSEISLQQDDITFTYSIAPNISIVGDAKKIEEMLQTLLINAVKYRHHHRTQHITVTLRAEASTAILSIHDTGRGISNEHLPHIFKRFYRIRENGTTPGSGLGLAIVDSIVRKHHGSITVASEQNHYTVFTITFPRE